MARKPTGNPNGRPLIVIDKGQFESLCNMQCTLDEIAGFFHCSIDTIQNWCKRTYDGETFANTYKKYSQNGKISLRRYQFKLAEKNASMAIWLGKQYLGQKDICEVDESEKKERINVLKLEQKKMEKELNINPDSYEDLTPLADLLKGDK